LLDEQHQWEQQNDQGGGKPAAAGDTGQPAATGHG
jgi:hypothetical protein